MTYEEAKQEILENRSISAPTLDTSVEALRLAVSALDKQIPRRPIDKADEFDDLTLCCPYCLGPVTNYWTPGTIPKHCQFCGQALAW